MMVQTLWEEPFSIGTVQCLCLGDLGTSDQPASAQVGALIAHQGEVAESGFFSKAP